MDSILKFIYFGKVSVDHSNMKNFAHAAKDLQIKQLSENIRRKNLFGVRDDTDCYDDIPSRDVIKDNDTEAENKDTGMIFLNISDEIINHGILGNDELGSGKQLYKCEECEASYQNREGLSYHAREKHEGTRLICKYCGYKATKRNRLKKHQESIHEGVKYSCDQCDYHATHKGHLTRHKQSVHDGITYFCDMCNHESRRKDNMKEHKRKMHALLE